MIEQDQKESVFLMSLVALLAYGVVIGVVPELPKWSVSPL